MKNLFTLAGLVLMLSACNAVEEEMIVESPPLPIDDGGAAGTLPSDFARYENDMLGLGFALPAGWDDPLQVENDYDHIVLQAVIEGETKDIFLGADNSEMSVARGSYWGDMAENIDSLQYVEGLCELKTEAESCEVKTNDNGVIYAEVVEEVFNWGAGEEEVELETLYYIFNPNSEFRGMILSDQKLTDVAGVESAAGDVRYIVETLYWL